MPSKVSPVSFRPTSEVEALLAEHVAATHSNRNAAINRLLLLGGQAYAEMPKYEVREGPSRLDVAREALAQAEERTVHLATPKRRRWSKP
jgi:hypothetical protein